MLFWITIIPLALFPVLIHASNTTFNLKRLNRILFEPECTVIILGRPKFWNLDHQMILISPEDPVPDVDVKKCANILSVVEEISDIPFSEHILEQLDHGHIRGLYLLSDLEIDMSNIFPNHAIRVLDIQGEEIFIKTFCYGRQRTFEKIPIGEDVRLKPKKCESWFKGRNVTVAVFGFLPFFTFLPDGSVGGGEADVIQILAQHYGFHVNFEFEAAGGAEKVIDENGNEKWIGIVGKVQNGSAQLGAGVLFMDFEYSNAVDFNGVLHQVMVKIMSPKAKPLKPYFNLLRPFPLRVWIPIFAVLFLTIVVYPILTKPFSQDPNAIRDGLIIYGLTFYQSYRVSVPDKWAPRLFLLANFFYLFFLFSSYECNLRAYLMSVDYEPVVNSEKDLLTMNKEIFLPVSTSFISMYQFSTLEIRQKIWNKVETNNLFYHPFEEFMTKTFEEKIIQRQASFLMSPEMALVSFPEFEKRHGYQPFHMSKEAITPFYTTFVSPKNKPWQEDTTHLVQRLFEAGITKTLIMNYVKPRSLLRDVQESNPEPFNLEHFLAAFISLGVGLMVSSLAFLMEIFCPPRILYQPSSP